MIEEELPGVINEMKEGFEETGEAVSEEFPGVKEEIEEELPGVKKK